MAEFTNLERIQTWLSSEPLHPRKNFPPYENARSSDLIVLCCAGNACNRTIVLVGTPGLDGSVKQNIKSATGLIALGTICERHRPWKNSESHAVDLARGADLRVERDDAPEHRQIWWGALDTLCKQIKKPQILTTESGGFMIDFIEGLPTSVKSGRVAISVKEMYRGYKWDDVVAVIP